MADLDANVSPFRQRRFADFLALADRAEVVGRPLRILDLGGALEYWEALLPLWQGRDFDITIVNLDRPHEERPPHYHLRTGDARAMPEYADGSFDIVHSNSVIEHVGRWSDMQAMAREVSRLGRHYFVQTPNLWFPLEAHYRVPFIQFLPEQVRARMLMRKSRGFMPRCETLSQAMDLVQTIALLTHDQLQALFPDGRILRERVAGLTKSITAIR